MALDWEKGLSESYRDEQRVRKTIDGYRRSQYG